MAPKFHMAPASIQGVINQKLISSRSLFWCIFAGFRLLRRAPGAKFSGIVYKGEIHLWAPFYMASVIWGRELIILRYFRVFWLVLAHFTSDWRHFNSHRSIRSQKPESRVIAGLEPSSWTSEVKSVLWRQISVTSVWICDLKVPSGA